MIQKDDVVTLSSRQFSYRRLLPASLSRIVCEQHLGACPVKALEAALAREKQLLREKEELLIEQELLRSESDHRLLNGLQMVASLLSLQSRAALSPEVAEQLSAASNRVATIQRVHRRLHFNDGGQTVALKKYLEDYCADFSSLSASGSAILVEGCEVQVQTETAIPLGFIASELITNAVKYGRGSIVVNLVCESIGYYALSVSNDGPSLPRNYDPDASKGLGMRIIRAFTKKIDGQFTFGDGENHQGACFVVRFAQLARH
jgi:two-component sensor histidine kinase